MLIYSKPAKWMREHNNHCCNKTDEINTIIFKYQFFVRHIITSLVHIYLYIYNMADAIWQGENSWVSVLLPTLFCFHRLCYKQLSKNAQNIRNPIPFWCKIKSPQQNCTKQKRGEFPVVNFTSNTYQMKRKNAGWHRIANIWNHCMDIMHFSICRC